MGMNSGIKYGNFYSAWNGGNGVGYIEATLKGEIVSMCWTSLVFKHQVLIESHIVLKKCQSEKIFRLLNS